MRFQSKKERTLITDDDLTSKFKVFGKAQGKNCDIDTLNLPHGKCSGSSSQFFSRQSFIGQSTASNSIFLDY
jgi:beta-lactamase superfamily II metal-dependent hydrolase